MCHLADKCTANALTGLLCRLRQVVYSLIFNGYDNDCSIVLGPDKAYKSVRWGIYNAFSSPSSLKSNFQHGIQHCIYQVALMSCISSVAFCSKGVIIDINSNGVWEFMLVYTLIV